MHPDERPARPTDARYRASSNMSSHARPESGPSPSRSQAQVARRRIACAIVISVGALLLLVGMALLIPQFSVLGILILLGVIIPHQMRARARKRRARSAKLRASAPPPATAYTQPAARPVVAPPPPLTDAYDAVIRGKHQTTGSPDGQRPPALPPRTGPALPLIWRGAHVHVEVPRRGRVRKGNEPPLDPLVRHLQPLITRRRERDGGVGGFAHLEHVEDVGVAEQLEQLRSSCSSRATLSRASSAAGPPGPALIRRAASCHRLHHGSLAAAPL
jgi:hypothetical protein